MKLVLDTNVLISAIISHGTCYELVSHCLKNHQLFTSNFIYKELYSKLELKFGYMKKDIILAQKLLFQRQIFVEPTIIKKPNFKDKDDLFVVGTAKSAESDMLITGDKELLKLKKIENIKIIKPNQFWENEK